MDILLRHLARVSILIGGVACATPPSDDTTVRSPGVSGRPTPIASSIDKQKSFNRKQDLQSRERDLEDRWHSGSPDRAGREGERRHPPERFDQRGVFDELQRSRSELERLRRGR